MTPATRHILFSVSKSVTGTLAGILVEEGKLDPEAPVVTYLPEVENSAYRDATVRHVLDMTVDLDFVEDYSDTKGDFARYRVSTGWNPPNPDLGHEGLHAFLATVKPAQSRHGETFYYASPNSDLLGWLLERVGGMTFAKLLSEKSGSRWGRRLMPSSPLMPRAAPAPQAASTRRCAISPALEN